MYLDSKRREDLLDKQTKLRSQEVGRLGEIAKEAKELMLFPKHEHRANFRLFFCAHGGLESHNCKDTLVVLLESLFPVPNLWDRLLPHICPHSCLCMHGCFHAWLCLRHDPRMPLRQVLRACEDTTNDRNFFCCRFCRATSLRNGSSMSDI